MEQTVSVWERVATLPPGPDLGCLLATRPWDQIPNEHLPAVNRARARQRAYEDAESLLGLVHMARSVPLDDLHGATVQRAATSFPWASSEIAAALTMTPTAADRELGFAEHVIDHLPLVFAALHEGRIDRAKTWIFTQYLQPEDLTAAQIATLCAKYVPVASGLTTRQLAGRLGRAVIAIDPALRKGTYKRSLRDAGVACYLDPRTGTATLAASGLPPDEAAAACARLDRLAEAARRAGCPGTLGQISTRLAMGMLDGRFQCMTEQQIIDALCADTDTELDREGVEVRVSLPTLMGRDERPGEIAGLGPVLADVARDAVERQHRGGSWQFAIIDGTGHLLHGGVLRSRPTRPGGRTRGGVVQIDVTLDELAELAADPGDWGRVLAEITRSWAKHQQPVRRGRSSAGSPAARSPATTTCATRTVSARACATPGPTLRSGPHPRLVLRRRNGRGEPRTPLPPAPHQQRARMDVDPARTGALRLAQPAGTDLPHPRRTDPIRPTGSATRGPRR